jgi:hypothetical protein
VTTEAFTRQHLGRILDFANRNNIPAMFEDRLMSYGPGYVEGFRTAAVFVSNLGSANISRFSWQRGYGTFYLLKSLPANGRASRPRRVLPYTSRDAFTLQSISPMRREIAATFLPHPALGMQQSFSR